MIRKIIHWLVGRLDWHFGCGGNLDNNGPI
jgi:hypothetical protein